MFAIKRHKVYQVFEMEGPQVITNDFELVVNIPINADAEDAAAVSF